MKDIFISYVVPCYNIQNYLPKCIDSLEKQSIPGVSVEFILVNDGSTDETLSVIKDFAERDDRVTVIDQVNQGVCVARNNGLAAAQGEYVFFLDGDDWMPDDASQIMYDFCKDAHPDIALFSHYKIQEGSSNRKPWYTSTDHIPAGLYSTDEYLDKTSSLPISTKLFNRAFLNAHKITFDRHLVVGEVHTFFIHALSLSDSVGVSPGYIMYYLKRRGESATTQINTARDLRILDTLHTLNQYVDTNCKQMREKRSYLASSFGLVTSFALIKYVGHSKYRKAFGDLLSTVKKDHEYKSLLVYFTGKGFSFSQYSLLAIFIRFFPPVVTYNVCRLYYRFATRNGKD